LDPGQKLLATLLTVNQNWHQRYLHLCLSYCSRLDHAFTAHCRSSELPAMYRNENSSVPLCDATHEWRSFAEHLTRHAHSTHVPVTRSLQWLLVMRVSRTFHGWLTEPLRFLLSCSWAASSDHVTTWGIEMVRMWTQLRKNVSPI